MGDGVLFKTRLDWLVLRHAKDFVPRCYRFRQLEPAFGAG